MKTARSMTSRVQFLRNGPRAFLGTQPVMPFGRIGRRTRTQYSPFSLTCPSSVSVRLAVSSGVSGESRVITFALALGLDRAATLRSMCAHRDIPFGPLSEKGSLGPLGVEGKT